MSRLIRWRPSGAALVAIVAVVIAAAGTATAATLITGADVKNGSLTGADVKNGSLSGSDVRNRSLGISDISLSARNALHGQRGAAGSNGTAGAKGATGASGVTGSTGSSGATGATGAPGTTTVSAPGGGFTGTNPNVTFTGSGVTIAADANSGGSLEFTGLNGKKLTDLAQLQYTAEYTQTGTDQGGGMPYLRVFLDNDATDVIFSPNTQQPDGRPIHSGVTQRFDVIGGLVRYNDDDGDGNDDATNAPSGYGVTGKSWDYLVTHDGNHTISGIYISAGFGGSLTANTTAHVNSLKTEALGTPPSEVFFGS
jgi:hypothetical protein